MDVRLERWGFVSERLSHAVSPQAAAFISILGSQICHLPRWHIRSLQFATALCVCLSVEAEIMKFSPVRLMHHCYCDTAVSTSCRGRGWQNGLQSPPSNRNQLHTDYLHTVSFFSLYAWPFFPHHLRQSLHFAARLFCHLKLVDKQQQQQQEAQPMTTFGFQMVVFDSTLENVLQVCCWWRVTAFELKYFVHAGDREVRASRLFMQIGKKRSIIKSSCRGNKLAQSAGKSKTPVRLNVCVLHSGFTRPSPESHEWFHRVTAAHSASMPA